MDWASKKLTRKHLVADRGTTSYQTRNAFVTTWFRDWSPRTLLSNFFDAKFSWRTDAPVEMLSCKNQVTFLL
jgi:hypothetical protein